MLNEHESYVSLTEATNYLIQFFYKTGKKYPCSRTQISKLMSIVAFKYACKEGKKLFKETMYRYSTDCGTQFHELKYYLDGTVYLCVTCCAPTEVKVGLDGNLYVCETVPSKSIPEYEIEEDQYVPSRYLCTDNLPADVKAIILEVFLNFGSYSLMELNKQITAIVEYNGITNLDKSINLSKLIALNSTAKSKLIRSNAGNPVAAYIFNA